MYNTKEIKFKHDHAPMIHILYDCGFQPRFIKFVQMRSIDF